MINFNHVNGQIVLNFYNLIIMYLSTIIKKCTNFGRICRLSIIKK